MSLPPQILHTIDTLGARAIRPGVVAPLWFRVYLRWRPLTPPPLFDASPGAWRFLAAWRAAGALAWLAVLGVFGGFEGVRDGAGGHPGALVMAAVLVVALCLALGGRGARTQRAGYRKDAAALDLPPWPAFLARSAAPAPVVAVDCSQVFWLRSLSLNFFGMRGAGVAPWQAGPHTRRNVGLAALAGLATCAVLTATWPMKAASYGEGLALLYLVVCDYGASQTARQRRLPANPWGWQVLNGALAGACVAVLLWAVVAGIAGYPSTRIGFLLCLLCVVIHLSEALWLEQWQTLSLRAARADAERLLAEARLSALKAQVEPHFIFNTIAHLRRMIAVEPVRAQTMADDLADFLRASLGSLRSDWTSVGADLQLVDAYLRLVAQRMRQRLSFELIASEPVKALRVPPLMLLTLVENAVQHGIEPKPEGGRINVRAERLDPSGPPRLQLSVEDSGVGFGQAASGGSGLGLSNLRERLRTTFGGDAELALRASPSGGVIASINLPAESFK
jgi:signal transduction histidine kinase